METDRQTALKSIGLSRRRRGFESRRAYYVTIVLQLRLPRSKDNFGALECFLLPASQAAHGDHLTSVEVDRFDGFGSGT